MIFDFGEFAPSVAPISMLQPTGDSSSQRENDPLVTMFDACKAACLTEFSRAVVWLDAGGEIKSPSMNVNAELTIKLRLAFC